jgi:hypothetical protein
MTVTYGEVFLFCWTVLMTVLWIRCREALRFHKHTMHRLMSLMSDVADGHLVINRVAGEVVISEKS